MSNRQHSASSYERKRAQLTHYFDDTAAETWARLTSDAPVSKIRETVRAGRDAMRATLLDWLGADLSGRRLLDAGCGPGALAIDAAARGAEVTGVDVAANLIDIARDRAAAAGTGVIQFQTGDMLSPALGQFDHVVAMDSLIHYAADDILDALVRLAARAERSVLFTVAPKTPFLATMHAVGQIFPKSDRSPAIAPISDQRLRGMIAGAPALADWRLSRDQRIVSGFYISHAYELVRADSLLESAMTEPAAA